MAVTKKFGAIPYSKDSKVEKWDLSATYENDSEGDSTYYTSTKSEIEALIPVSHWDAVFASQVDSVITNPVTSPEADNDFTIPS